MQCLFASSLVWVQLLFFNDIMEFIKRLSQAFSLTAILKFHRAFDCDTALGNS